MHPKVYCDLAALSPGEDTGMSAPLLRGHMLALLHPFFANHPHTYALAIPQSDKARGTLRVFATTQGELDGLVQHLRAQAWMRDYARIGAPQTVPEDFSGTWFAFRRWRIPTLKADRHTGEKHGALRQRRMEQAKDKDYFIMRSASTGQRFTLIVAREQGQRPQSECLPNSYGLCAQSNLFCLPEL